MEEQLYWVEQCLRKYPEPPHITNLTQFHGHLEDLFDSAFPVEKKEDKMSEALVKQLRWVTLGVHYDWTKRKYDMDKRFEFPKG